MKTKPWKAYAGFILGTELVGGLAALITREGVDWYNRFAVKPPFSPPPVVFPIAWGVLYLLMGAGCARVWLSEKNDEREKALTVFAIQLAANFFWSIIFFNFRAYGFAFVWILALLTLVVWMTLLFRRVDIAAGTMQIPYILWVAFASWLTLNVWRLN